MDTNLILTLEEVISLNGWENISSTIYEKKFGKLEKPIINIGARIPIIQVLLTEKEKNILPSVSDIEKGILNLTQIN